MLIVESHRFLDTCEKFSSHFASAFAVVNVKTVAMNEGVDEIAIQSIGDFLETFVANVLLGIGEFQVVERFWLIRRITASSAWVMRRAVRIQPNYGWARLRALKSVSSLSMRICSSRYGG